MTNSLLQRSQSSHSHDSKGNSIQDHQSPPKVSHPAPWGQDGAARTKMTCRESDFFTGSLGDLLQVCTLNSPPIPRPKSTWKTLKKNQKTTGDNSKAQML